MMKKCYYKNILKTVYKFLLILIKEYYFNLRKYREIYINAKKQ